MKMKYVIHFLAVRNSIYNLATASMVNGSTLILFEVLYLTH